MMKRLGVALLAAIVTVGFCGTAAQAAFNLVITEIWPGNSDPGMNLTEDWFELTNLGDMAWTAATDGDLWFDDDSFNPAVADLMSGIASIAPGESVIYVNGDAGDVTEWSTLWGAVVSPLPQIGIHDGSGLGQGGDAIGIFLDTDLGAGVSLSLYTAAGYPNANSNGGQSYDTIIGAFSTVGNAHGAVATALNDENQPAIGSPGSIPEPASIFLVICGLAGLALSRRR